MTKIKVTFSETQVTLLRGESLELWVSAALRHPLPADTRLEKGCKYVFKGIFLLYHSSLVQQYSAKVG